MNIKEYIHWMNVYLNGNSYKRYMGLRFICLYSFKKKVFDSHQKEPYKLLYRINEMYEVYL